MYSKSKNKPSFVTTGDSIGYILECTDQQIDKATDYYEDENSELNMVFSKAYSTTVPRYSFRKSQKIYLKGVCGQAQFEQVFPEQLAVFYAGELLHKDKGISFGFGRYHYSPVRETVK